MKNIEIEVRSFIDRQEYQRLFEKLRKKSKFLGSANEETIYFKVKKGDLRLRRSEKGTFLIFKEGKIHDDSREEIEILLNKNSFRKIEELFKRLGFKEEIRWFRKRTIYKMGDLKVFLDDTKGYGLIVELEKIGTIENKEKIHKLLEEKMKSLGIAVTPKRIFEKKFKYYKNNWRKILSTYAKG